VVNNLVASEQILHISFPSWKIESTQNIMQDVYILTAGDIAILNA
jgi:hypothetical protein